MRETSTPCPKTILPMPMLLKVEARENRRAQGSLKQRTPQGPDLASAHSGCSQANVQEATLVNGSLPTPLTTKVLTLKEAKVSEVVLTAQVKVKVKAIRILSQHHPPEYQNRETLEVHHLPRKLTDSPVINT